MAVATTSSSATSAMTCLGHRCEHLDLLGVVLVALVQAAHGEGLVLVSVVLVVAVLVLVLQRLRERENGESVPVAVREDERQVAAMGRLIAVAAESRSGPWWRP